MLFPDICKYLSVFFLFFACFWLGHRQISPSLSALFVRTFLACGASDIVSCIRPSLADRQYRPARSARPTPFPLLGLFSSGGFVLRTRLCSFLAGGLYLPLFYLCLLGWIISNIFHRKILILLHISKILRTFAPAKVLSPACSIVYRPILGDCTPRRFPTLNRRTY